MKTITPEKTVTVASGIVRLQGAQAKTRAHNLKALKVDRRTGDGEYEIASPIQFKAGEKFGFDGEITKTGLLVARAADAARPAAPGAEAPAS